MSSSSKKRLASSSASESDENSPKKSKRPDSSDNESPVKTKVDKKKANVMKDAKQNTVKTESPKEKKSKKEMMKDPEAGSLEPQFDDHGNKFFDIGRNRRISLSNFKGKQMINIREFYKEKGSNTMKPGKSGIALYEDEWKKLITLADEFKFD